MGLLIWIPLVLAFVLFKENRRPAALWILLPAGIFVVLYHGIVKITDMPGEYQAMFAVTVYSIAISFCLVWLLAARIGGRHRFLTAVWVLMIFLAMMGLSLSLVGSGEPAAILAIFTGLTFAVFAIAFTIAAILCRKRTTGVRFTLAMIPGCLIGTFLPFSAYMGIMLLQHPSYVRMISEFLMQTLMASGFYYVVVLPFLILFFVSAFWRQRFEAIIQRKKIQPAPSAKSD